MCNLFRIMLAETLFSRNLNIESLTLLKTLYGMFQRLDYATGNSENNFLRIFDIYLVNQYLTFFFYCI